jgi:hypothetical protein
LSWIYFFKRSHIKESAENQSKVSDQTYDVRPPTAGQGIISRELDQDDLYATIEPNDILDLPRV